MAKILNLLKFILGKSVLVFKLEEDFEFYDPRLEGIDISLPFVTLKDGVLTIMKGYAWDGCTPKRSFFDVAVIGTPDGIVDIISGRPKTYYASLVHDALYQYELGTRKDADKIFYELMKFQNFKLSWLYYFAIRIFGRRW